MELIKKEDYETYDIVLPQYVVSITLKKKKKRGFKQIKSVREDLKEEVRGITIQALIRQQHFNTEIVYKLNNYLFN